MRSWGRSPTKDQGSTGHSVRVAIGPRRCRLGAGGISSAAHATAPGSPIHAHHGARNAPPLAFYTSYNGIPRTRTRLPCTPALAPPNRISGRARLPRTSPTACAMGRQRTPPPCLPKAPRLQLPLPHEHQSHARAWRVRRLAKPYRVSLPPITRRSPSSSHRSKQAPSAPCSRSTSRDSEESTSPPRLSPRPKRSTPTSWK